MRPPNSSIIRTAALIGTGSFASLALAQVIAAPAGPKIIYVPTPKPTPSYTEAIRKTAAMATDATANRLATKLGLDILDLTWEDTGRYANSSVGPNISDMTIQVADTPKPGGPTAVTCMPVIRFPNFSDKTCDLSPRDFTLLIGNQANRPLRRISLYEFLKTPTAFMTRPWSWKGKSQTLLASRDSKVLVSAQACFLPIPRQGKATFNPVLFNYQSTKGDPAVLTILATREGTSMTVIDNERDAFQTGAVWGQRLFHNANGQRASLTGSRQSEFLKQNPAGGKNAVNAAGQSGLNMVLLIQVPLKQRNPMRFEAEDGVQYAPAAPPMAMSRARSDVENAVIGHGALEGKFTETDFLPIERDPKFPVRVTVQFYKATSNGVVSQQDLTAIKQQIQRVYNQSDYVGSLVTGGETGRITQYEGVRVEPADWWEQFWQRREKETGKSRQQIIAELRKLLGRDFVHRPVSDLYLRNKLSGRPR